MLVDEELEEDDELEELLEDEELEEELLEEERLKPEKKMNYTQVRRDSPSFLLPPEAASLPSSHTQH